MRTHLTNFPNPVARAERAFTMVEIALALGIIGFALVAIIGTLPMGLNTQKDNREETIINQEGLYWIEAIRNGAQGFETVSNFVDFASPNAAVHTLDINGRNTNVYEIKLTSISNLIGILTLPKKSPFRRGFVDKVTFKSRALTGAAAEQSTTFNEMAFTYEVTSELSAYRAGGLGMTATSPTFAAEANKVRSQTFRDYQQINGDNFARPNANLYELKLTLRYPAFKNGAVPRSRRVFRTLIDGQMANRGTFQNPSYFVVPQTFVAITN